MADRLVRFRRADMSTREFDTLYPQTVATNIFRDDPSKILEDDCIRYDNHLRNTAIHFIRGSTIGTGSQLGVTIKDSELVDGMVVMVTLHTEMGPDPTLSFNGSNPIKIIGTDGLPVGGGQIAGTQLMLCYNKAMDAWVLMNNDIGNNITRVVLPLESEYVFVAPADNTTEFIVPGFNMHTDNIEINYYQTVLVPGHDCFIDENSNKISFTNFALRKGEEIHCRITKFVETVKQGLFTYYVNHIDHVYVGYEPYGMTELPLPLLGETSFSLTLNYNQTVLRNTLDYTIDFANKKIIFLNGFKLRYGEKMVLVVTQYNESVGVTPTRPYSYNGTYRYSFKILNESFTAAKDNTVQVVVPNFDVRCDQLTVIQDNKMLVRGVDYDFTNAGEIILLKSRLAMGDTLYFTILQGATVDVPTYAVEIGSTHDGTHWNVETSHVELKDMYHMVMRLPNDMKAGADLKYLDGPALPIVEQDGLPNQSIAAGSYLSMIYEEAVPRWVIINSSTLPRATEDDSLSNSGEDNFIGGMLDPNDPTKLAELKIPHGLIKRPSKYWVQPTEPPTIQDDGTLSMIGDYWVTTDDKYLYVGNTGTSTSKFNWYAEV